jgi:hypothetical protein
MKYPNLKMAADSIASIFSLLAEGIQGTFEQLKELIRCSLIFLLVKGEDDDLGTWDSDTNPSDLLKYLWYYIHDGWHSFTSDIYSLGRALRGDTYEDLRAEWRAESAITLEQLAEIRKKLTVVADGPRPWERKWSASISLDEEISNLANKAGWHRLQDLTEIFQWALASPQGQRAAELAQAQEDDCPFNPWKHPYELIHIILPMLVMHSHLMLSQHAQRLQYSQASTDALEANLTALMEADRSDDYSLKP